MTFVCQHIVVLGIYNFAHRILRNCSGGFPSMFLPNILFVCILLWNKGTKFDARFVTNFIIYFNNLGYIKSTLFFIYINNWSWRKKPPKKNQEHILDTRHLIYFLFYNCSELPWGYSYYERLLSRLYRSSQKCYDWCTLYCLSFISNHLMYHCV